MQKKLNILSKSNRFGKRRLQWQSKLIFILERGTVLVLFNLLLGGQIFWSGRNDKSVPTEVPTDYSGYQPPPADVEMTGYALMSYLKRKEMLEDVTKIVKWLSKQRNEYGGFSSTQVCTNRKWV